MTFTFAIDRVFFALVILKSWLLKFVWTNYWLHTYMYCIYLSYISSPYIAESVCRRFATIFFIIIIIIIIPRFLWSTFSPNGWCYQSQISQAGRPCCGMATISFWDNSAHTLKVQFDSKIENLTLIFFSKCT